MQSTEKLPEQDFMTSKWRPMMAVMYMIVCICDFVLFPVMWSLFQAVNHGQVSSQWQPITLQGAGLFHMAMGAVLGVAAWSRGQEKMAGVTTQPNTNIQYQPRITPRFEPGLSTTQGFNGTSTERSYTSVRPSPPPAHQPEL